MNESMDTTGSNTVTGGNEIQLSITKNYASHWDTWEGVREMVQNWHDGLISSTGGASKNELKFKKKEVEFIPFKLMHEVLKKKLKIG